MMKFAMTFASLLLLIYSCASPQESPAGKTASEEGNTEIQYDANNAESIIKAIESAAGGWENLWKLNDVEFTYTYHQPETGKKDESVEQYHFDSESSRAVYETHEVNVFPDKTGKVIQCYDGTKAEVMFNGKKLDDPEAIGLSSFLRTANYFWFTMNFKLGNPGTAYELMDHETVNNINYDKVKVSYDNEVTGKPNNDTFILFVNPETHLVDRFLFSLPDWNVMDPVLLMEVEYSEHEGLKLPTKRYAFIPDEQGNYASDPSLVQTTSNIKFNNGFTLEDFRL